MSPDAEDSDDGHSALSEETDAPALGVLGLNLCRIGRADFKSKLGGHPCWLEPTHLPDPARTLLCAHCHVRMTFLLQLYVPKEDESPAAFHRTLMVFTCRRARCSAGRAGSSFKVLRCQLPRRNAFYPYTYGDPPPPDAPPDSPTCVVCGLLAPRFCGACRRPRYSCRTCQRIDWGLGHRYECRRELADDDAPGEQLVRQRRTFALPELEICIAAPSIRAVEVDGAAGVAGDGGAGLGAVGTFQNASGEELPEGIFNRPQDEEFLRFQRVILQDPGQVLRYGARKPLWAHREDHADEGRVPACERCGGPRVFEFQIMPQLLYMLGRDYEDAEGGTSTLSEWHEELMGRGLSESASWATVAIYTCAQHCPTDPAPSGFGAYAEEFVWVQME